MVQIVKLEKSERPAKKYKVYLDTGKVIHFGLKHSHTFIDGADNKTRDAYLARHLGNKIERRLINNRVMSPSLLSAYVLWGKSHDIEKNVDALNSLLRSA